MAEAFIDTNVLVYLLSANVEKAEAAEQCLARGGHVSVQVLNEFTSVARRKARLSWREIEDVLGTVRRMCTVHSLDVATHDRARELAERYGVPFYDAAILASASGAECTTLWSEDLQAGQRIAGVTVRNPFRAP